MQQIGNSLHSETSKSNKRSTYSHTRYTKKHRKIHKCREIFIEIFSKNFITKKSWKFASLLYDNYWVQILAKLQSVLQVASRKRLRNKLNQTAYKRLTKRFLSL